jgi:hypothetical protein
VGIHAVGRMASIGKTAFAVHAAHRLAGNFPASQFFLPLHAHTAGQRPVEALASLLLTAGLSGAQIPPGPEAWRPGGATTWLAKECYCCSTTRPGMSRSGRCPAPRAASRWAGRVRCSGVSTSATRPSRRQAAAGSDDRIRVRGPAGGAAATSAPLPPVGSLGSCPHRRADAPIRATTRPRQPAPTGAGCRLPGVWPDR